VRAAVGRKLDRRINDGSGTLRTPDVSSVEGLEDLAQHATAAARCARLMSPASRASKTSRINDGSGTLRTPDVSSVEGLEDLAQHATLEGLGGNALQDVPAHCQSPCHVTLAG
jgi:hypothetical protein